MKDVDLLAGIEYPLFTEQAKPYNDRYQRGLHEVRNLLIAPLGLSLPLEVKANITSGRVMDSVMPYGNGYKFDIRDTTWDMRVEKILSLPRRDFLIQDFPDNPYELELYADEHTLGELGFSRKIPYYSQYGRNNKIMRWHFKGPARETMERLRVEVIFPGEGSLDAFEPEKYQPGGVYQGARDSFCLSNGYVEMGKFYPTDIGPLPLQSESEEDLAEKITERFKSDEDRIRINPDDITFWEGLNLRLPKNTKQLLATRIKFRLINDEEKAFESN